ncbi:MAG: hypothetical protein F6K21_02290 [Symploca sp. SIO2D2]|nr:hypothetical protein [Symploca sp. SIO2D2]
MENFALGIILFIAYFSFLCCLLHQPHQPYIPTAVLDIPAAVPQQTVEQQSAKPAPLATEIGTLPEGVDLDQLPLRKARKVAKALSIPQKLNGRDQPLSQLRVQIKKRLTEQPTEVAPIIASVLQAC